MNDNYLQDLFIDEVKGALNAGGGSGGATHWDDLEGRPFGEEKAVKLTDVYKGNWENVNVQTPGDDNWGVTTFQYNGDINCYTKYDISIRGDVYRNVAPSEIYHNYYDWITWGGKCTNSGYEGNGLPFSFTFACYKDFVDADGTYIGDNTDAYFEYDTSLYPNLDINTEVVFYSSTESRLKIIDSKYLPPTIIDFNATEVEGEDGEWYIQTSVSMTADELREEAESGRTLVANVFGSLLPMKYIDSWDDGLGIGFSDESINERYNAYAYMWTEEDGTVGCEAGFIELTIPRITSFNFEAGITKYDDFNDRSDRDSINSISVEFMDGTTRVNDLYTIVDTYFWNSLSKHPIYTDYLYTNVMAIKQENNYSPLRNPHLGMLHLLFDKNTRMFYRALFVPNTYFYLSSSTEGSTKQFKITVDDSGTLTATEVTE